MGRGAYYRRLVHDAAYSLAKGLALPFVRPEAVDSGAHGMIYPVATYSPWLSDADFQRVYRAIRGSTLVDQWRCYELWSLLGELRPVPGGIIEVGVWRGGTGALMAARCAALGIVDQVVLCDTWHGVVKTTEIDTYYDGGEHDDASKAAVQQLLTRMGVGARVRLLQGIFPDETGAEADGQSFRLVHIDVDVYQSAADAFAWARPRLSPGGAVVFDDYGHTATPGITRLVDGLRGSEDLMFFHNLNGHGILLKR
jgi:O-methyltransferase